ncbi:MAG: glycogen/starch synthase [Treponema sp.]|nr:glycogen/starch synthase [Treponema sp.]
MKILMISAEATPFAKTGGLADAVSALSQKLSASHQTIVFMPRYYNIDRNKLTKELSGLRVFNGNEEVSVDIYSSSLGKSQVKVVFLDYEPYFGRQGIYGSNPSSAYNDNPIRFSFFCRAAFAYCLKTNWIPDVLHCHDWSSSFALVLLKHFFNTSVFSKTKGILTIHNLGYQGTFPQDLFCFLGLPIYLLTLAGFSHMGGINFLKAGITCADQITTVSPTYAKEIQSEQGGCTLDGLLRVRSSCLTGIINGIDMEEWSSLKDPYIPFHFSYGNMEGKALCKKELQKRFGLEEKNEIPIIAMTSRLVSQKGIDEVFAPMYGCAWNICTQLNVQFIVLGAGETWCENEIHELERKLVNFKSYIGYDEALSHLIEAGSDFFLMPSHYEPCGLNQIYSQVYGTIPIVRKTGGLTDTVEGFDSSYPSGFFIDQISPEAVFNTVKEAVNLYHSDRSKIEMMQTNGMKKDFSWQKSAEEYIRVYKK